MSGQRFFQLSFCVTSPSASSVKRSCVNRPNCSTTRARPFWSEIWRGRIRFWNKGAEHLYGWTAKEALGRDVGELQFQNTLPQFEQANRKVIEQGEWTGELNQLTKDGRKIITEGYWTLVRTPDGQPRSILAVKSDITEKKRLETQYLRAQRMESIGTLAGGIAHDLNNILSQPF